MQKAIKFFGLVVAKKPYLINKANEMIATICLYGLVSVPESVSVNFQLHILGIKSIE